MTDLGAGAEFDAIRKLLDRWGARASGIGDDAAVVPQTGEQLVVSVDSAIEGRHFKKSWMSPRDIGYRAAAAALSDLAAMAARPIGILVALGVPPAWRRSLGDLADGIGDAAQSVDAKILGGNLTGAGELSLTTTVIGSCANPLLRSGARVGQSIWVTGTLGSSGESVRRLRARRALTRELRQRFVHPVPRVKEAMWLQAQGATAAIDISDGLSADLGHLAAASGVRIEVDLPSIPTIAGVEPLRAVASGEEYELIVAAPASVDSADFSHRFAIPLTRVGRVVAGSPGVVLLDKGKRVAVPKGYDHFSR